MTEDDVVDGVAVPARRYTAEGFPRARYRLVIGLLALGLGIGFAVIAGWDALVKDAATYRCPPDCGRPPNALPVANSPRFVSPDGQYSVDHPLAAPPYEVTTGADGVTARWTGGDGGVLRLFSQPAQGRVARQVVEQLLAKQYPGATVAYTLPNTMVGYQLGHGVVANFQKPGLATKFDMRVIVLAAVKNDLALIALAEGPFRRFSPDFGPGPPSAANLEIAMDLGKYVDSFRWKGDPPR
jgi:hypothetical protein